MTLGKELPLRLTPSACAQLGPECSGEVSREPECGRAAGLSALPLGLLALRPVRVSVGLHSEKPEKPLENQKMAWMDA